MMQQEIKMDIKYTRIQVLQKVEVEVLKNKRRFKGKPIDPEITFKEFIREYAHKGIREQRLRQNIKRFKQTEGLWNETART